MRDVVSILSAVRKQTVVFQSPSVTEVALTRQDPYLVLISCILSLRTKDKTTAQASTRLFSSASNPSQMLLLSASRIQRLIYPVGFYRTKARTIREVSLRIIRDFKGRVPDTQEGLLSLKGVGLKTASLVLGLGYHIPAICVDTHVHRISHRLGWVQTESPEETQKSLQRIIPRTWWICLNTLLVRFGQNVCLPVSPFCSLCTIHRYCKKRGVSISR
ncbi:MAG: endonuclease III [Candidatus Omnitrophica bacterium]|nr:endonuclease III [Candidatus Omnitrophota bacterium]